MADAIFFGIVDAQLTAAGVLGGLVHAYRMEKASVREVVGFLVVGGIAANFITPGVLVLGGSAMNFFAPRVLEILALLPPVSLAFWIGMCGRPICYALEIISSNWLGKEKNE